MLVKFLLGIVIIVATSLCGYLFSKKYRVRSLFFQQFREFNERFLSEISYHRRPIKQFVESYAYKGEFSILLQDFFDSIDAASGFEIAQKKEYKFLKKEEQRFIEDYFYMFGKGDSASQKAYFSSLKDSLNSINQKAKNERDRYVNLYIKIGFLCGLLILILII